MFILRAIGNFFVRIGRWIKNTAWIQPLLIVGGIFGIIFSIPYITKWVGTWFDSDTDAEVYYKKHKVSLDKAEDHNSKVDHLFDYLRDGKESSHASEFGDKFFVTFVQEGCSACEERYGGFETLQENWGKGEFDNVDGKFKLYTVYVDDENDDNEKLFKEVFERPDVMSIFETAAADLQDKDLHPYALNGANSSSYATDLENLTNADEISTPTTFLIDFTDKAPAWTTENGIREVLFSFESTGGSDNYARARTLRDAWTNESSQNNKFCAEYRS